MPDVLLLILLDLNVEQTCKYMCCEAPCSHE